MKSKRILNQILENAEKLITILNFHIFEESHQLLGLENCTIVF